VATEPNNYNGKKDSYKTWENKQGITSQQTKTASKSLSIEKVKDQREKNSLDTIKELISRCCKILVTLDS
jgi:hypothetical protein